MNIKDIAKLAGVSASTVSKVINNKDRDISEVQDRVYKAHGVKLKKKKKMIGEQ